MDDEAGRGGAVGSETVTPWTAPENPDDGLPRCGVPQAIVVGAGPAGLAAAEALARRPA